jgi:hypothetical protein
MVIAGHIEVLAVKDKGVRKPEAVVKGKLVVIRQLF